MALKGKVAGGIFRCVTGIRAVLIVILLFAGFSIVLIPYAGLQDDEIVFANPLNRPSNPAFCFVAFHRPVPLMIQAYAGTLKTALYWPLLHIFRPGPFTARLPMVFAGALTILLFYKWSKRIAGAVAALIGTLLFATDPSFILTNTFDWGPVALQLLLTVAGCWLIAKGRIPWGLLLFGLALWNKATFSWTLAGLAAGTIAAFRPELQAVLKRRAALAGALCTFLLGAMPLLIYNVRQRNSTLHSSTLSLQDSRVKFVQLRSALAGSSLFGYLVSDEENSSAKPASSPLGRVAVWIREHCGNRRESFFPIVLLLSLAAVPIWWRSPGRQAAIFALVSASVMFLAMLVTRDAGGAVHHIVLLWPMPQLLAGIAIASLRPRWLLVSCAAIAIVGNLLVLNQYLAQFERNGAGLGFSDAAYALSDSLSESAEADIYVLDWGISNSLDFLHSGKLNLHGVTDPLLSDNPTDAQRRQIDYMLHDPSGIFLDHVQEREFFSGTGERLARFAQTEGYGKETIRLVRDSNGRAIFELFRFRPSSHQNTPTRRPRNYPFPALYRRSSGFLCAFRPA